ncbi:MAG: hypothetical protein R6X20_08035 [Phycisphaerae bacterium]
MARWQRDPAGRRRVAYLLVGVEVLALTACAYGITQAYTLRGLLAVGVASAAARPAAWITGLVLTVVALALGVVVGLKYVAGRRWARGVFIVANALLVGLGLLWFVIHQIRHGGVADNTASLVGLLLPMVTLFPLLWPLLRFRPVPESGPGAGP